MTSRFALPDLLLFGTILRIYNNCVSLREPAEIDFMLISKTWTAEEEKEFSELILQQKNKQQRRTTGKLNMDSECFVNQRFKLTQSVL